MFFLGVGLFSTYIFLIVNKDELKRDVLLWIAAHEHAFVGLPFRTYLHKLHADTGCCFKDMPEAVDDKGRKRERERVR